MLESQPSGAQEIPGVPSGTVTFLFTDIEGSTKLLESLREQYADVLDEQRRILRAAFSRWNGLEIDTLGDASFIAFTRATEAVNSAIEAQNALAAHQWPQEVRVRVRMGLHTGEALISRGEIVSGADLPGGNEKKRPNYIGMDVHRAARIASAGYGGQVLLSQTTRDLVYQDLPEGVSLRDLGLHALKDIRYPQQIYQLVIESLPNEFPPLKTLPVEAEARMLTDTSSAVASSQREVDAYRNLLKRWRAQGLETVDKASLSMLIGAPEELAIDQDELVILLRSALKYNLALDSWIKWASSPSTATAALDELLQEYPRPQSRLVIVEALCGIADPPATEVLLRVACSDDAHLVRSLAALEVASRSLHNKVVEELSRQAREQGDPAAITALVAVIDEYGLPEGNWTYPRLPVTMGLIQRRWLKGREAIRRRTIQGAVGGGIAVGLLGSSLPLLAILVYPEAFEKNLEFISVPAWTLSGAIAGLVWGVLQGLASGFALSLTDVIRPARHSAAWRFIAGGLAGLVFSILWILFASAGLLSPAAGPEVFVPVFLVYGFLQGGALSWVIPRLGVPVSMRLLALRVLQASLFIGLVALPSITLVYQGRSMSRLPIDVIYAILVPGSLALTTNKGLAMNRLGGMDNATRVDRL